MKAPKTCILGCCFAGMLSVLANGQEITLMPVGASGSHSIVGNEIVLDNGGQRVFLEIFVADWDPDLNGSPKLRTWQVQIDSSGYTSAVTGTLAPATEACDTDGDCETAFGTGALCDVPPGAGVECTPGFIGSNRSDYVFAGLGTIDAVDMSGLDYIFGSTIFSAPFATDPGEPRYAGNLVLDVSADAMGTFTIGFVGGASSFLRDEGLVLIEPLDLVPGFITIACELDEDCDDDNPCTEDECVADRCVNTPVDCSAFGDQCNVASCDPNGAQGNCDILEPVDDDTPCDDDDPCNIDEACQGGVCMGGDLVDCSGAGDQCNTASCDPDGTEGNCNILTPVDDGTPCDDEDPCNIGETCQASVCTGGDPPDCSGFGDQCNVASCDPGGAEGNCDTITQVDDGTPCNDEDVCNVDESCQAGFCTGGGPVDCSEAGDQCNVASCDPGGTEGNCDILTQEPEGTPCDDGDPCTGTGRPGIGIDTCRADGQCLGDWDDLCNDDCEYAIEVTEGVNTGNNDNRGEDDAEASCKPDSNNDVWFVYTPICSGEIFVSTTGSTFEPVNDPVLSIWDACPDESGTEIACDDESGVDLQAALTFMAAPGATYWIRVAGDEDNSGDIVLNISTVNDCLIAGSCYAEDAVNPENECEACIPDISTSSWSFRLEGTPCGDYITDTECDSPDACDGAGVCEANHEPDFRECMDDGEECTYDYCMTGACTHPPVEEGTACGDPGDPQCDDPDTCDGEGACQPNHEPNGTPCDDEDICTADECQEGVCVGTPIPEASIVEGVGCRLLNVTPQPAGSPAPVALLLTSPDWECLEKYIALNGYLVEDPVFQVPDDWGTIVVRGPDIVPSSTYHVVAECGTHASLPGIGSTALWGDTVGFFTGTEWTPPNGVIDFEDITATVDKFRGLPSAPPLEWVDIFPCTPDGIVDFMDITYVVDAFRGLPYPCPVPCP